MSEIKRNTIEYRVLVEVAGLDRATTEREVWENINGVDAQIVPADVKSALQTLYYGDLLEHDYNRGYAVGLDWYRITWQGTEALRRLDAVTVNSPKLAPPPVIPWWAQHCAFSRLTFIIMCAAWLALGVAYGWLAFGGSK